MSKSTTTSTATNIYTLHTPNWNRLFAILNERRPHGTEAATAERWLSPYSPEMFYNVKGEAIAYAINVYTECDDYPIPQSRTLFSAHLDTVHREAGRRKVKYDPKSGLVSSPDGTPLGADDGAGIWLLLEMIDAGVPGCYLFTVGEECGGIGAKCMASLYSSWLSSFNRAIAFDRKGTSSVITHQGFGRCCSDEFAETLAGDINFVMGDEYAFFSPDDTGIYTDTAEYIDCIPECTNISVGYRSEHTQMETLDINYLSALRNACLQIDWETLPVKRDPSAIEYQDDYLNRWAKSYGDPDVIADKLNKSYKHKYQPDFPDNFKDIINANVRDLSYMIQTGDPDVIADIVQDLAYEIADLKGYWK